MKKIFTLLLISVISICLFSGCGKKTKGMKISLYYADENTEWNVWAWKKATNENYSSVGWPGNLKMEGKGNGFVYTTLPIDRDMDLGILFVASTGSPQTADIVVPAEVLQTTDELCFIYGVSEYYTSAESLSGIKSAVITDDSGKIIKVKAYGAPSLDDVTVADNQGNLLTVSSTEINGIEGIINVSDGDINKLPYLITYKDSKIQATLDTSILDKFMVPDTSTLGCTVSGNTATFKTWAPTSSSAELLLYKTYAEISTAASKTIPMAMGEKGVWSATVDDIANYKYYKYKFKNSAGYNEVCDIWNNLATGDSEASQIITLEDPSTKPAGWDDKYYNPFTGDAYSEAIIYEMHIRDWSRAFAKNSTGKFDDITSALSEGEKPFAKHLKDLGITHVQILPMFDYAQTNNDENYNWGYNPYHYNVPEGRYTNYSGNEEDGKDAAIQMRKMIKAFHDEGIAVIMDVVYNHTSGTGLNSLYDKTIPEYFYRVKDGQYVNGSGCGNEIATNHTVVTKYVIESMKHWMNDYHINGFRFDLMGCLESTTMKLIYDTLYDIDPKVMVYGEPWTGGTSAVVSGATAAVKPKTGRGDGTGAFDDEFRNAVKGGEFGGFQLGQVQGAYVDEKIVNGLTAKTSRNKTGNPKLTIHYVECHDNYTLADKLCYSTVPGIKGDDIVSKFVTYDSLSAANKDLVRAQDKLSAAYIFLAQGTPFINGGQEFMRTKKGNPDSYASDKKGGKFWSPSEIDECNTIDLSYKTKFEDVYNVYKGLIAFRKANSDAFGANKSATATTVSEGVTQYITGNFCVYFNATSSDVTIDKTGYSKSIDVSSGTPTDAEIPAKVSAKSFVILEK